MVDVAAGFVVGLVLGAILARRGRFVAFDWRLRIRAREGPDEPTPPDGDG